MSQENVELAYLTCDAVNRHDLGAVLALMDDDVEGIPLVAALEGGCHGHDGIRRWWENLHDGFPDFTIDVVEVRDLGDLTLAALHLHGHGAGSDTPFELAIWYLAEWRNGKAVSWSAHRTQADALEAADRRD